MPSILLVDDDRDDLFAFETILEPLGLEIVCAESGEEALRKLLERDLSIILMDVMMPGMNGFETAALIRQRKKLQDTPIIFLSGFDRDSAHLVSGYADFSAQFLRKPVTAKALRDKIQECLRVAGPTP